MSTETSVLVQLEEKFKQNLLLGINEEKETYSKLDVQARAIAALGQLISEIDTLTPSQREIVCIFDEVFADITISIYLAACSLDNPAQSILRRALELGIAIVYLWDLPHAFWGWKSHDADLNFNEMVEYLAKDSYKTFLISLNPSSCVKDDLFDYKEARKIYRMLSNTVHGKITTHITNLTDRFTHQTEGWKLHLTKVDTVLKILLGLMNKRFFEFSPELKKKLPTCPIS